MVPVRPSYPSHPSGWMFVFCPLDELKEKDVIAFVEGHRCHRGLVVVSPPFGQRVDRPDEFPLREASPRSHLSLHFLDMSADGFLTGGNEGLETQLLAIGTLARSVFPDWVLPDGKAQKVKPYFSMIGRKGMSHLGFTWLHFQSHAI